MEAQKLVEAIRKEIESHMEVDCKRIMTCTDPEEKAFLKGRVEGYNDAVGAVMYLFWTMQGE